MPPQPSNVKLAYSRKTDCAGGPDACAGNPARTLNCVIAACNASTSSINRGIRGIREKEPGRTLFRHLRIINLHPLSFHGRDISEGSNYTQTGFVLFPRIPRIPRFEISKPVITRAIHRRTPPRPATREIAQYTKCADKECGRALFSRASRSPQRHFA
jgi:hypothetical protein